MIRALSAPEAKRRVHAAGELAFLDLREAGEFGEGHPLFAVPCPYSRLEALAPRLVPRRDAPVLLIDGGDGVAERAATALERLGYADLSIVEGGAPGWAAAGLTLYKGVNVPSKTLGELAEHRWRPETVDPRTLARWRREGRPVRLFDARPPEEYAKMRVPGAVCLPNGELAHRWPAAMRAAEEPVVVTCAGRTRGVLGALGLRLAGVGSPVYALENGTQGWALAGLELERGNEAAPYPALDAAGAAETRARADALLRAQGVPLVDAETARGWLAEPGRTTFLLDVRSAPEAAADPAPAFAHAPSGQLVQATDAHVGVRRARLVLLDDLGLRAGLAACWLRLMGHAPLVARIDDAFRALAPAPPPPLPPEPPAVLAAGALAAARAGRARLVDLRPSAAYRAGHVEGAVWSLRPRLARLGLRPGEAVRLIAEDATLATLAAAELRALGADPARVEGGHAALVAAGARVEASAAPEPAEAIDFLRFVHDRHDGNLDASRAYLAWEQGLVAQLDPQERAEFAL